MSVRGNGQRIFILVIVGVFVVTTFATTGFVIYDAAKGDSNTATTDSQQEAEQQANQQQPKKEGGLEGTKLAGFTPVAKVESLQVTDTKPGTGTEAKADSTITAHYTGALAKDGTIFQSSKDTGQPFTAPLSNLIPGWQQGIPGMKAGGTRRIVIPAAQAYGEASQAGIPANSDLVFDIELIEVK